MENGARRGVPAVSWIAEDGAMAELVYAKDRATTSFAYWDGAKWDLRDNLELPSGERLVPFSPRNNLIKNEVVVLPSEPAHYGSEQALASDIQAFIHRYLDVTPTFERIATYYVLLTWLYDAFKEVPYLRFQGDYGTGKTRALLTIGSLCYKSFFASGASTVSPIFHILDAFRGTLVIDEADFRFSDEKAEIVKILNNGNVDGLPVLRTLQDRQREFNPRAFRVFGPKIVAMRGSYDDRALESRFLTEAMGTRDLRGDVPINLPDNQKQEALELRNKLLLFRFYKRAQARLDASLVNPLLEPRLNQILVPLLSVIGDAKLREEFSRVASGTQAALVMERRLTVEAQVLEALLDLMSDESKTAVPLKELTTKLLESYGTDFERPLTNRWVGLVLRKRLHIATYKTNGVIAVPITERAKVAYLSRRYGLGTDHSTAPPGQPLGI